MNEAQVRAMLDRHDRKWEDFIAWIAHQTVAVGDDGQPMYYGHDVMRFCYSGRAAQVVD
jgi:hypothetical protein